ncbi:MAG: sugar phosphate nucleotidyltransferase [bacterium]
MAAGKGTRMKSDLAKVLHTIRNRAMIQYVLDTAFALEAQPVVVIIGHQKERVRMELRDRNVLFAVQEPQLGTGHAVSCALPKLEGFKGLVMILSGDVPLIRAQTLQQIVNHHIKSMAVATVLTAKTDDPTGYGRIIRSASGNLEAIIEERDADEEIARINEINSGIYVFQLEELRTILPLIGVNNDQKEYYLTDAIRLLAKTGKTVAAMFGDFREIMGINTVAELQQAERMLVIEGTGNP